ncbi:hypothetical protein DM02DRAFT_589804 [Periconia macrospinosa]|uniref:Rhodopsin domain-containing protein n=1 Tax=Periconia macrospinosa TaxID=97972 RepID=A0A2V1DW09_9PLEO|nr:hypothetical protein DM02DRAFT_589804 [Periconia macrospinosa]
MLCTKLGITLQYLRMFAPNRTVNPFVFYSSWITMVLCTVFYIITTILTVYACSPREKIWNKLLVGGKCLNYRGIILSTAIFNIASDVAILMLPVHTVWNLRIPRKKKIAICFLFGTGSLACVASTMRAVYTMRIIEGGEKADVSYNSLRTALWSYTESTLGVIVACIISFPKLWKAKGGRLSAFVSQGAKKLGLRSSPQSSDDQLPQLSEIQLPAEDLKKLDSAQS